MISPTVARVVVPHSLHSGAGLYSSNTASVYHLSILARVNLQAVRCVLLTCLCFLRLYTPRLDTIVGDPP